MEKVLQDFFQHENLRFSRELRSRDRIHATELAVEKVLQDFFQHENLRFSRELRSRDRIHATELAVFVSG